jgi:hypothetical protein
MFGIGKWEMVVVALAVVLTTSPILVAVSVAVTVAYLNKKKQ